MIKPSKDPCCKRFCVLCQLTCCCAGVRHPCLKAIAGCVFGILLGIAFYLLILLDMELGSDGTLGIAVMTIFILAAGNAASDYVRCVCLLTLPAVFGRTGRSFLKAFAMVFVLSGPLTNLALNGREVIRVFGCTSQLTYNLTKTKFNILLRPFQEAQINMRHDEQAILNTLETIQDVVDPLVQEVEGQDEVDRLKAESDYIDFVEGDSPRSKEIEKKYHELRERRRSTSNGTESEAELYEMEYKRKVEYRCEGVVNQGTEKCRQIFQRAYDSCYDAVSAVVAWLLCWPMKLTFMCNLVTVFGGNALCDPSRVVEPGFGQGYATVKNSRNMLHENLGDVKIKYKVKGAMPKVDSQGAAEFAHAALRDYNSSKAWFDTVSLYSKRLFALVFLFVVYRAAQYQERYLTELNFDNKYITPYFKKLDRRQRENGLNSILPLRIKESKYFMDPSTIFLDRAGICKIVNLSILLLLEMLPVTVFFLLDFLLYEILEIISTHALVEYTQKGEHYMSVKVHGGGLVANLVRSLVRDLNVRRTVHVVHSNVTCLPRPNLTAAYYPVKVYTIYFVVWLLIILDGYSIRLNRLICSHFYPKREKKRVLYLYNEILRSRARKLAELMTNLPNLIYGTRYRMNANWFLSQRLHYPSKFGWLRWFSFARRDCLICGELEPPRHGNIFLECPTPGCSLVYCKSCWKDVKEVCYGCQDEVEEDDYSEVSEV